MFAGRGNIAMSHEERHVVEVIGFREMFVELVKLRWADHLVPRSGAVV